MAVELVEILTSSKEEKDLVNSYQLGVNSYIQKPVDFEKFRETVQRLRFYGLPVNQPALAPPPLAQKGSTP